MKKTTNVHLAMEIKKNIVEIVDYFSDNPEKMCYFYEMYQNFSEKQNNNNGKKVIATMCVHVPVELIYALGAKPLRFCSGAYSTDQVGAEFLPAKTCPIVKSIMGALYLNIFQSDTKPALVINPTTCDQKKKIAEIAADFSDLNFYTLELPPTKDSKEAEVYWQRVVSKLARELEKVTNTKLTRKRLKNAINLVYKAQAQYRRFNSIRRGEPVIRGKDAVLVTNSYFHDDIESWTKNLALLNDELEDRVKGEQFIANKKTPRILLTGSPSIFPNMKAPVLIEQLGGIVVAEEFCSTSRLLHDTVAVDEWFLYDMLPAIADRYLKPCTCPNFTPNTDRLRKLLENIKEFSVDGVIYQSFAGCQLYEMESL